MVTVFLPWTLPDKQPASEDKETKEEPRAKKDEGRTPPHVGEEPRSPAPPSDYYLG